MTGFSLRHGAKHAALAAIAVIAPASVSAGAQMVCGEREVIVAQLERKYGETRRSIGLQQQGRGVVEVYASEKTGSWTILLTDTKGKSCLMAAGDAFQALKAAEADTQI